MVDIAAFGGFMIRGEGAALGFAEAGNAEPSAVIDFQERVTAAAESSFSVSVQAASLKFHDSLSMDPGSSLRIEGAIDYLKFAGGVELASESSASVVSSTDRSIKVALGSLWYAIDPTYNQGSFSLQVRCLPRCIRFSLSVLSSTTFPLCGSCSVRLASVKFVGLSGGFAPHVSSPETCLFVETIPEVKPVRATPPSLCREWLC